MSTPGGFYLMIVCAVTSSESFSCYINDSIVTAGLKTPTSTDSVNFTYFRYPSNYITGKYNYSFKNSSGSIIASGSFTASNDGYYTIVLTNAYFNYDVSFYNDVFVKRPGYMNIRFINTAYNFPNFDIQFNGTYVCKNLGYTQTSNPAFIATNCLGTNNFKVSLEKNKQSILNLDMIALGSNYLITYFFFAEEGNWTIDYNGNNFYQKNSDYPPKFITGGNPI